jgi:electron transfer flavoprotein alpha subunit
MKIVVLVKQVPRPDAISFDDETKALRREGVPLILNPFDAWAVEHAAALRAAKGGEVVAMTMGPPQAHDALRTTLALGADRAVHLSDPAFALADTIGTSRTLALALEREGADLVLCGRQTVDSETSQVPPEVAARLGWPHLTAVSSLAPGLHASRETDQAAESWELPLPAVVSVAAPEREPRAEDFTGEREHGELPDGPIDVWTASELVDDLRDGDRRFGQVGSPTRVLAVRDVTPERARQRAGSAGEAAAIIRGLLDERPPAQPSWDKPPHAAERPKARYDSWAMIETVDGRPTRTSLELLARSRELAGKLGGRNVALVFGRGATGLGRRGAELVHRVANEELDDYHPQLWAAALRSVLERSAPHVLLVPASLAGREYAARAAGELELGMTGDCVAVDIAKAGRLLQTKPAYGGNIVSVIMGSTTPQLATVRPRMYEPLPERDVDAEERSETIELPDPNVRLLERSPLPAQDLDEADVLVVIGAAVGGEAAARGLEQVAGRHGAAVGGDFQASRLGWFAANREVSMRGRAVAPRVSVGVGSDGSFVNATATVKAAVTVALGGTAPPDAVDVTVGGEPEATLAALLGLL